MPPSPRQYVSQKELGFESGVGEATVYDWIVWTEDTLMKSRKFRLPGKKVLPEDNDIEVVLIVGFEVAPLAGLEPATHGLEIRCSIQLSYKGKK